MLWNYYTCKFVGLSKNSNRIQNYNVENELDSILKGRIYKEIYIDHDISEAY